MGKAKMVGMNRAYIANAKADMVHRRKLYQRGLEYTDKHEALIHEIRERREMKRLEALKYGRPAV